MLILITGASGLLGKNLLRALRCRGHEIVAGVRDSAAITDVAAIRSLTIDFSRDLSSARWLPRLRGVDVVINTVGIIAEESGQSYEHIHTRAPQALFRACAEAGVKRVIQISALGADDSATTEFLRSKKRADDYLLDLPIGAVVVLPSLIFACDGESTQLFARWAGSRIIPLPGCGDQRIQPLHVDDLTEAVVRLVETPAVPARIAAVGARSLSLRDYLAVLRRHMRYGTALFIRIPPQVLRSLSRLPMLGRLISADNLAMLERGNCADAGPMTQLLGRAPLAPEQFLGKRDGLRMRHDAALASTLPLLRIGIALLWIGSGLLSFGLFPVADSLALLARTGLTGAAAQWALYGAATVDVALGILSLTAYRQRWVWSLQILFILGYTAIISWKLPEYWLHPYAPILKNIPLLAALLLLRAVGPLRRTRWNT